MGETERGEFECIVVNLTPRSQAALSQLTTLTGDSTTDAINRAIQVYNFLEEIWQSGGEVKFRRSERGIEEILHVF